MAVSTDNSHPIQTENIQAYVRTAGSRQIPSSITLTHRQMMAVYANDYPQSTADAERFAAYLLILQDLPFQLCVRCHVILGRFLEGDYLWHAQEAVRLLEAVRLPSYEERVLLKQARETMADAEQVSVMQNELDEGEIADDEEEEENDEIEADQMDVWTKEDEEIKSGRINQKRNLSAVPLTTALMEQSLGSEHLSQTGIHVIE